MNKRMKALGGIIAIAGVFALAACSGGSDSDGGATGAITPEAEAAAKVVEQVSQPVDEFTAPGPAIEGVDALAGETVFYIPATMQVPLFKIQEGGLKGAFAEVGVNLQTCDAKANPQDLATCLGQAVDASAAAVIIGSLPISLAPTAFQSVVDAGIPIVISLVSEEALPSDPPVFADPTKVGYTTPNYFAIQAWNANAVIADSNGSANVLVVQATDTPSTKMWTDMGALPTYAEGCPNCVVETVETTTSQINELPSLISSRLVANPDIKYIHLTFDSLTQATIQGIQAAGASDVKIVSMDGYLDVLQGMKANGQVIADTGLNIEATAWYAADQALRLMTGGPAVEKEVFPFTRMFTPANVGSLDLTPEGQGAGSWYGKADYKSGFTELWGLK